MLPDFLCLPEQPVRQTVLVGCHFMVTDAVPDRVLKSGHQPFHTPDLFLVPLDGEMLLKEGDVGIIPRQADPDGSVFRKRLSKYIFYSSFSLLTFATKK